MIDAPELIEQMLSSVQARLLTQILKQQAAAAAGVSKTT